MYWNEVTHQFGNLLPSMRSSSNGTAASAIGEARDRKQNAASSQSTVSTLTRGVISTRAELTGWTTICPMTCGTLLPSD